MTSANERQIGGDHYGGGEYQHWDWVADIRLPYHPATASKYVDRWRQKDGKQALEKAIHYLEKTIELSIVFTPRERDWDYFWNFVRSRNHPLPDANVLFLIQQGHWHTALEGVKHLLAEAS